jgi:hypothetical protein
MNEYNFFAEIKRPTSRLSFGLFNSESKCFLRKYSGDVEVLSSEFTFTAITKNLSGSDYGLKIEWLDQANIYHSYILKRKKSATGSISTGDLGNLLAGGLNIYCNLKLFRKILGEFVLSFNNLPVEIIG